MAGSLPPTCLGHLAQMSQGQGLRSEERDKLRAGLVPSTKSLPFFPFA